MTAPTTLAEERASETTDHAPVARRMSYEMAGELPSGGFYQIRIGGPLPSKMLRHVEALVRMAAEWLEEDEKEGR